MLRHGGSKPCIKESVSQHARRGKNAEAFLIHELHIRTGNYEISVKIITVGGKNVILILVSN